jgi:hypothetical protein
MSIFLCFLGLSFQVSFRGEVGLPMQFGALGAVAAGVELIVARAAGALALAGDAGHRHRSDCRSQVHDTRP